MANVTVFDPVTVASKNIAVNMQESVIQQDEDGTMDYFLLLTTSAKKVNGNAIPNHTIRTLSDLAKGTTTHAGGPGPYLTLTAAVQDHVLNMVEGSGAVGDEMSFS